ncbi:cation diffusion facilitator family transporter [Microcella humidisoli]|uniref:Cation diffusion facilitator family transporter n=1 Tax=Microcella humidisoli TaxID=2963406 RepID=A0ABY5FZY4_9MICO|nr:cation diffusion facilitator family transporter [Microcella humidisoli]UTT63701.1 cation diffusion facilitator family transporter [Microcella humidisoli]
MSASGGGKAIIAALLANTGIAVTKFVAFLVSGSSAMLAESVHSVADAGNQLLLLVGGRRARKAADTEHPFGYGRARYIYAFVVAIILFSIGGVFSLYEGVSKLQDPHPLENAWLPIVVLLIAIGLESFSLRTAVRESNHVRGTQGWIQFIRRAKAPELPVVLLEDVAALLGLTFALFGVGLTILTGDSMWDAVGTIMIGVLLVLVAVVLGLETGSLLVGEGASNDDVHAIRQALDAHEGVTGVVHMKTLYLGPDELLVGAKVTFTPGIDIERGAAIINELELAVRAAVPIARVIYIEPGLATVSAAR